VKREGQVFTAKTPRPRRRIKKQKSQVLILVFFVFPSYSTEFIILAGRANPSGQSCENIRHGASTPAAAEREKLIFGVGDES
jgi:hypothetical protein